jgi:hypothetical protein
MKVAIAQIKSDDAVEVYETLDKAIAHYESAGFDIAANLNTQSDLSRGGVRMEKHNKGAFWDLVNPKYKDEVVVIMLTDVR